MTSADGKPSPVDDLRPAILMLEQWLRDRDYCGHDPYDMLSGRWIPNRLRTSPRRRQFVVQAGKWSPLNLRSVLGVRTRRIAKASALVVSAYALLERSSTFGSYRPAAEALLADLEAQQLGSAGSGAWGYEFDVQTRWAFYPEGTPNIIVTTFVAHAFLDWYEVTGEASYLEIARSAMAFIDENLRSRDSGAYYVYVPGSTTLIHNANILGCALASRLGRVTSDAAMVEHAREAARSTMTSQLPNGLWPYGAGSNLAWADSFHTAYVLDGLCEIHDSSTDAVVDDVLDRGFRTYMAAFFTQSGMPKYTPSATYPIDIHCAATSIDVLSRRRDAEGIRLGAAARICGWTIGNMRGEDGSFFFRRHRVLMNRIRYVRWSQAHMFKALASLNAATEEIASSSRHEGGRWAPDQ